MGPRTYYTLRQVRWLLGGGDGKMVDGKSLKKWLDEAGIEPQQNLRDKRQRRITRSQLEDLARKHRIPLPDDGVLSKDVEHLQSLSAVALQIEEVKQMIAMMQDRLERMQEACVAQWQEQLEQATQRIFLELEHRLREQFEHVSQVRDPLLTEIYEAQEALKAYVTEHLGNVQRGMLSVLTIIPPTQGEAKSTADDTERHKNPPHRSNDLS